MRQKACLAVLGSILALTSWTAPVEDPYESMVLEQEIAREDARKEREKHLFPAGERFLSHSEKNTWITLRWYAAAGDLSAQTTLADAYMKARISHQDVKSALYWYELAASSGDTYAQYMAGVVYQLGLLDGKPDAEKASRWFTPAAHQEDKARAMRRVAMFFAEKNTLVHNMPQAFLWYEKAAYEGDVDSQLYLADQYLSGEQLPQNALSAIKWYGKAAAQNSAYAQYSLGVLYLQGAESVSKDYNEAVKWVQKSAWQGFHAAQYLLGNMYYKGQGVLADPTAAYAWWKMANRFQNPAIEKDIARVTQKMSTEEIERAVELYEYYQAQMG